jgi:hypothetical protein
MNIEVIKKRTKAERTEGSLGSSTIDFEYTKRDYYDFYGGFTLTGILFGEEKPLFSANPLDVVITSIKTTMPGSFFAGDESKIKAIKQPAIALKYLLDELNSDFNWNRMEQVAVDGGSLIASYLFVEYLPTLMKNVYFKQFFTELLYQFTANTIKTGGDIKATVENLDFLNAGVKGLFGSRLKWFQELAKSYLDINIKNGKIVIDPANFNEEEFYIELFYRQVFAHLPSPAGDSEKFAWDVIKKMTRSEAELVTNQVIEQMKVELEKLRNENAADK